MMNVVGLCLVVTSLVTAGVWSPNAPKERHKESLDNRDMIVKEGHRVVVVEYDQEDQPVTKVSISPETDLFSRHSLNSEMTSKMGSLEDAKEKFKEACDVLPNLVQGLSAPREDDHRRRSPKELICDAYGKCKHKIADAIGRTKETVSEAVHEAAEKAKEAEHRVEEAAHEAVDKTTETKHRVDEAVSQASHEAAEKAKEAKHQVEEAVSEASHEAAEKAKEAKHQVEEAVSGAAHEAAEKAKRTAQRAEEAYDRAKGRIEHGAGERARRAAKDVRDVGKTIGVDVASNVTGWLAGARNELSAMLRLSATKLNPLSGVVYVLAFSTAFGTGVWVTFALSHVLARALPRQQFGIVQSKVYPVYFRTMAAAIGAALLAFVVSHGGTVYAGFAEKFQAYNLLASLLMVLVNMLFLEPRATKAMFEKMKVEKEEGRGRGEEGEGEGEETTEQQPRSEALPSSGRAEALPEHEASAAQNRANSLNARLKKLNTLSSLLNILSLMALSWHVSYLGHHIHMTYNNN